MLKVPNEQVVKEVAVTNYKGNWKSNLLTVFAIILTTFLIATVLVIGQAYYDTVEKRQLYMVGMDYDLELTEPRDDQIEQIKDMDSVDYVGVAIKCAIVDQYQDLMLSKMRLYWLDKTCWERQTIPALQHYTGTYPQAENEIMISGGALRAMGIEEPQVGMRLPLHYTTLETDADGTIYEKEFVLSGWYTDYSNADRGYVSEAFWRTTGVKQTDYTQGSLKITLKNPLYSRADIIAMQNAVNLDQNQSVRGDYATIETFIKTVIILGLMLLMIFVSGYLFIFNTMYISILKDIRYYGQLKTLGMTSIQMKRIVYLQALWNALAGIPLGMLGAVAVAVLAVPSIIKLLNTSASGMEAGQANIWVFVMAAFFAFIVNLISSSKPAQMVGACSPIEAIRYLPTGAKRRERQREMSGIPAMASQNIFRDRKQAVVILTSFGIALSLFLVVNVIIRENDARRMLSERKAEDFTVQNNTTLLENEEAVITAEKIAAVEAIDGVRQVRKVMSTELVVPYQPEIYEEYFKDFYQGIYSPGNYEEDMAAYQANPRAVRFTSRLTIVDEAGFALLNAGLEQAIDAAAFERGEIAIALTFLEKEKGRDFGMVGKSVTFSLPQSAQPTAEHQIRIAAVQAGNYDLAYFAGGYTPKLVVSENYARKLLGEPYVELIDVVYEREYSRETDEQVKAVFADDKQVSFDSKLEQYEEMQPTERQVKVLGGCVSIIIALLAVLNYFNMIAASVQTRSREFATLESIGMTEKMIHKMLRMEGLGYAGISIIAALAAGLPTSYIVFSNTNEYGVSYSIPWVSNLILFAVVIAICAVAPVIIYKRTQSGSVVERLK